MIAKKIYLETTDWIEFNPQYWKPKLADEKMAAIIGYMTGDGSIGKRSGSYTKTNGEKSVYEKTFTGAFYSNVKEDLEEIASDCESLALTQKATVTLKKNNGGRVDGYQFQIAKTACENLVDLDCPIGKKTEIEFDVPSWIAQGSVGVKRAYISALFGAEGTMPAKDKASKSRFSRQPILTMCKVDGKASGEIYFERLKQLLFELGVSATVGFNVTSVFGKTYRTNWLRVSSGADNLLGFYENVGFAYCAQKSIEAWKWSKYLRTYISKATYRKETVIAMRADSAKYSEIGTELGITKGAVHRLEKDMLAGKTVTPGHSFPHYSEWIETRWLDEKKLLRLEVVGRKFHEEPMMVWNLKVSSHDHSYLLASGANNYNSFETMSGRVYYSFDRTLHVGNYPFNPKLPIWIGQDFNIDPMSTVIMQPQTNGDLWIVDEIILFGSNTEETCDEIERGYWRYLKNSTVYPDPAGSHRQHARGETDLDVFRSKGFKRIKHRSKHPAIADRVNAVNRMLKAADGTVRLRVNSTCKFVIDGFEQTIYKKGSREVDKSAGVEHPMDACGYAIEIEFPIRKLNLIGMSR